MKKTKKDCYVANFNQPKTFLTRKTKKQLREGFDTVTVVAGAYDVINMMMDFYGNS